MKKALIIIFIILCFASLYSSEPVVKFYLQDGSSKQYNLSDIESMKFSYASETLQFHIFKNNGKSLYYPAQLIDIIKFTIDKTNENRLHLWHDGSIWDVAIHEIDSILLYYTTYTAVTIGEQHWMYKDLNVDHYRNGDSIPEVRDSAQWAHLKTDAWCYFNNDSANGKIYGKLYNWNAVNDTRGLAPQKWHVPTDTEWTVLSNYLGGVSVAGGKMKEIGTSYWTSPNTGATNESGFSGLPGGYRYSDGMFRNINDTGYWWSATENNDTTAWRRYILYNTTNIYKGYNSKVAGRHVRCVKD